MSNSQNQYLSGSEVEQIEADPVLTVDDVIKFREANDE